MTISGKREEPFQRDRQRIISNLFAMGVGQVATFAFSLLLFVLIGRYLGPSRFGELVLAKAIVMVAWLGVSLGMETLIVRTVARVPERAGQVASAAIAARCALAAPVLLGVFVFIRVTHLNGEIALATYLYGAAQSLWAIERVLLAVFQAREHMSLNAKWSIGRNALALALVFLVRWQHGGVVAFAATQVPVELALLAVTLHWMRGFGRLTWRVPLNELRNVTQGSLAFWASEVFFTTYLYVDAVILAALAGTHAVGIYTPATQMLSAAMFLTVVIGPATLPQLSRLGVARGADFRQAARGSLFLFMVAAVPLTIGAATFSGPVITAVFGSAYRSSIPVAVALSLAILPMFFNFQFSQILAACDRQWRWTLALAGCCVVNPPLNFILIPLAQQEWHNGALGAALAWLVTELLELIYGVVLLRGVVMDRAFGRVVAGTCVAGLAQVAALWIGGFLSIVTGEILGLVAYGTIAVMVGALPRGDLDLLWHRVMRRLAPGSSQALRAEPEAQAGGGTNGNDPVELRAANP